MWTTGVIPGSENLRTCERIVSWKVVVGTEVVGAVEGVWVPGGMQNNDDRRTCEPVSSSKWGEACDKMGATEVVGVVEEVQTIREV